MFGLTKRERRDKEAHEIRIWIIGQSIGIGSAQKPDGNVYFDGTPAQMAMALEAACFFLHATSRLAYRPNCERLREVVVDPAVHQVATTFSEMLQKLSPVSRQEIIDLFNSRDCEYASASSLVGEHPNDANSALRLAAVNVAAANKIPRDEIRVLNFSNELLNSLVAMNLARRIDSVEANLTH